MMIHCSDKLLHQLNIKRNEPIKLEEAGIEYDPFYTWHAQIARIGLKNTVILVNDKTRYCVLLRNYTARSRGRLEKQFAKALFECMERGGFDYYQVVAYTEGHEKVTYIHKPDRQITGVINQMVFDMRHAWELNWDPEEFYQIKESYEQNGCLRRCGDRRVRPYIEMQKALNEAGFPKEEGFYAMMATKWNRF